jgi:putative phosphoribosyl transferase
MEVEVAVRIPPVGLEGDLVIPPEAPGIVVFAHGSGSSRHSSRNRRVAGELQRGGLATLLMDLLTEPEEDIDVRTRHLRFDIGMLADRLLQAADWLQAQDETSRLKFGFFGASTGGGAALVAAARRPDLIAAVVSRGGRPDLAGPDHLARVQCPTLLLVGSRDEPVIEMNESAMRQMRAECRLEIVPGATHLFEEPGTLDHVARRATEWFGQHLHD